MALRRRAVWIARRRRGALSGRLAWRAAARLSVIQVAFGVRVGHARRLELPAIDFKEESDPDRFERVAHRDLVSREEGRHLFSFPERHDEPQRHVGRLGKLAVRPIQALARRAALIRTHGQLIRLAKALSNQTSRRESAEGGGITRNFGWIDNELWKQRFMMVGACKGDIIERMIKF